MKVGRACVGPRARGAIDTPARPSCRDSSTPFSNAARIVPDVMQPPQPLVSIVVRSFNRVPTLCRLLEALLAQTWSNLEIVVVEQSTTSEAQAAARLAELARDRRVVILRRPPLGGAAARNVGVARARGEVLLFIDDDDLPENEHWVALHMQALGEDARCLGVSGRHIHSDAPHHRTSPIMAALTRTLSFDPILKISLTYVQHDRPRRPVYALHGTNASLRRSAWQRFGGWDEDTAIEDEVSFCFRALRLKRRDEYFAYDPRPAMLRDRDVPGGLGKRHMSLESFFGHYLDYIHRIIGRYYPLRVLALYPLYLVVGYAMAVGTVWLHSRRYRSTLARLTAALELLVTLPLHVGASLARLGHPPGEVGRVSSARGARSIAMAASSITAATSPTATATAAGAGASSSGGPGGGARVGGHAAAATTDDPARAAFVP
jgi:glycosyltransferase involved in cell wall biosynthesis